ncbi:flagellar hook-length control protein FliK [Paeniglutamicibacter kerguelensis]|uniref:Flagellar hook-length control protein-like C-terminal domain-containing protein n=1 Tax=Paeniglutamicibacter kerguelensis TaxID=254788 RepID=A0ABS4XEG2_9MICC|nr:flagellar hook-length control protein FliK [Paeniglutamicibacter kerguelensis]MBP2386850.1 hypothetical protein [Paeniglutamicibacter kerguelensis]
MIPLLLGVQPAQSTTQTSTAGSSDSGSAFGHLLASALPADQDAANTLDDTAIEPETAEEVPAGMGSEAFGELHFQDRLATLGSTILPIAVATPVMADPAALAIADPANPALADQAVSGESEVPLSLVAAPDVEASAPANPPAAAPVSGVAAGSTATLGTNPGVASLASVATPGTRTIAGGNAQSAADEVQEPATVPVDEVATEAQGPAVALEARLADLIPENKPSHLAPTPGLQGLAPHDAARSSRPETLLGVGAVSGGKTLAVENVVSREPQAPPINRQLLGPISALAAGPHGERTLSVNIAPEALGPVTVKAHLGHEGMRVELTAPTEAGREALRAMLPELRRDLAATGAGTVSIGTATDPGTGAGTYSGGGQASMANDQRFGGGALAAAGQGRQQDEETAQLPANEARPSAHASSHLDVMA